MSDPRIYTGQLLLSWIHEHCKTVRSFCDDIGFPESTVRNWYNNDVPIPIEKMAIIGEYFSEITGEPPHVFVMRLVMHNRHVVEVVKVWQKKKNHKGRGNHGARS
jgi:hypothetical protein